MTTPRAVRRRPLPPRRWAAALLLAAAVGLAGCAEEADVTNEDKCSELIDKRKWDSAVTTCQKVTGDRGHSLTAVAYLGRAGVILLDLIQEVAASDLQGLALILEVFTVDATQFADVDAAIGELLAISSGGYTDTDYFNLVIASDVILASLIQDHLGVSVDVNGQLVIPGITDTNIGSLDGTSTPSDIQTVFQGIYGGTYYTTQPLNWDDADPAIDLAKISTYVQALRVGKAGLDLSGLSDLDFAAAIDNGTCGLSAGQTASGADNAGDGPLVARDFPRRLNTSDSGDASFLADELLYVILDTAGSIDNTKEWEGSFRLPSALLNPDFFQVECDGDATAAAGEFGTCMGTGTTAISPNTAGAALVLDPTLTTTAGGTGSVCDGVNCTVWPLLEINDNPLDDESGANGATAMTELAAVLHTVYPIDNSNTSPTGTRPAYACAADDGLVHYREYDHYLRTFGQ